MARKRVTDSQPLLQTVALMCRRAWVFCNEAIGASLGDAAPSADLGGSSKYSNENFED